MLTTASSRIRHRIEAPASDYHEPVASPLAGNVDRSTLPIIGSGSILAPLAPSNWSQFAASGLPVLGNQPAPT
jgi:hypothetical protein